MEFTEFFKQKERMCESYNENCEGCMIKKIKRPFQNCGSFILENPEKAEEIIKEWAEEQPIMTNADKFESVFGYRPIEIDGTPFCSPEVLKCGIIPDITCMDCTRWWGEEYQQPKGENDAEKKQ